MNDFEHIGSFCIPHFRRRQTALPQSVHTAAVTRPMDSPFDRARSQ